MDKIDEQLRFAINRKRLLKVRYNGYERTVEPHDYGMKNGIAKLLVFQIAGGSSSNSSGSDGARGWKMLIVSKIAECTVLKERFPGSRGDATQQHTSWDKLYSRVA